MTFRFFKLAAFSLLVGSYAGAQTPGPTPDPKDKKPKEGYFRFWNMMPKAQGSLALVKNDGSPDGVTLITAIPQNNFASYEAHPAGRYSLKVVRPPEPAAALQTFDLLLRDKVYVTFIASLVGGQPKIEMIDDTYDHEAALTGRLAIRQYFPNTNVLVVAANPRQSSRVLANGDAETLDGFPLRPIEFQMSATHVDGKVETWAAEIDFSKVRHASLLVIPDPYGRFRPRVSLDGKLTAGGDR